MSVPVGVSDFQEAGKQSFLLFMLKVHFSS